MMGDIECVTSTPNIIFFLPGADCVPARDRLSDRRLLRLQDRFRYVARQGMGPARGLYYRESWDVFVTDHVMNIGRPGEEKASLFVNGVQEKD
jgi:hypothetical protein